MSAPSVPAASATGVLGAYGVGGRFNSSSRAHPAAAVVRGIPPRPSHSPAVGASVVVLLLWRPMAWKWYVLDTQATVPHVRQYVWYSTQTFGAIWRPLCPIGPCSARACRKHVSLPVLFHVARQCCVVSCTYSLWFILCLHCIMGGLICAIWCKNPSGKLHDAPVRDYYEHHTVPRDKSCVLNLQPSIRTAEIMCHERLDRMRHRQTSATQKGTVKTRRQANDVCEHVGAYQRHYPTHRTQ